MDGQAIEQHFDALLQARPELRLAAPYLRTDDGIAQMALASIEQQWVDAVYAIGDTSVAARKLHWWADELAAAREGHTHHPLATALFASERARQLDADLWGAAIEAGLALREDPPARDFSGQVEAAERFHGALARLETTVCFGAGSAHWRAARLATLDHLMSALLHLDKPGVDNDVLPMQLLARHALDRGDMGRDTPAGRAAMRDQLTDLHSAFADAMYLPGPLPLLRELSSQADRSQLSRALKSSAPLAVLASPRGRVGPAMAWRAWRAARRQKHTEQQTEDSA
ncbi:MAG: phytoene synthase [Rhodanobacteraceae bacterium]